MGALTDADASAKSNPFNPIPADGIAPDVGPPQAAPAATRSLTQQAAAGFAWALTQSLGLKVAGIAGQIALARLLVPEHFGVVAVAVSAAGIVQVLQWTGVQDVLVKRQRKFDLWATPGFWLSASMGAGATAVLALSAPILASRFGQPQLMWLVLVLALANLINTLGIVPQARLQSSLRFKAIAAIAVCTQLSVLAFSVTLAILGFGPLSLVLPQAVCAPFAVLAFWRVSGLSVGLRPHFQRWKYLFGDSVMLLGVALLYAMATASASMALAANHGPAEVGVYAIALNLSMQTVMAITGPLAAVFFPSLARLQNHPERMLGAFVRASRMLALLGVPLCFLQAVVARPGMTLLFGHTWDRAIPVVELLSIGLGFAVLSGVASSIFKAQGRFKTLLWWSAGACLFQIVATVVAARIGDSRTVALAGLVYYAAFGPAGAIIGVRPVGGGIKEAWLIYGPPVILAAAAAGFGWFVGSLVQGDSAPALVARASASALAMLVVYVPLVRVFQPGPFTELVERFEQFLPAGARARVRAMARLPRLTDA